jgi:catechol 2,3-dioxygenase-like lactoylglutathione lyase family enzyme
VEKRVHFITLATADLDAARAFYSAGLGWEPLVDVPGEIIFLQVGPGLVLGLFDKVAFDSDINGDNDGESNDSDAGGSEDARPRIVTDRISGITLSHNVDGPAAVDEAVSAMVTAGAVVLNQPTNAAFGGYHGHVQDPNGVIWEIAYNPGWRMDDTGRVFLE